MIKEPRFGKCCTNSRKSFKLLLPVTDIFFRKGNLGSVFSHKNGCQFNSKNSKFFRLPRASGMVERLSLEEMTRFVRFVRLPRASGMVERLSLEEMTRFVRFVRLPRASGMVERLRLEEMTRFVRFVRLPRASGMVRRLKLR